MTSPESHTKCYITHTIYHIPYPYFIFYNLKIVETASLFSGRGEVLGHRAIGEKLLVVVRPEVLVSRAHQLVVDDRLPNRAL